MEQKCVNLLLEMHILFGSLKFLLSYTVKIILLLLFMTGVHNFNLQTWMGKNITFLSSLTHDSNITLCSILNAGNKPQ